MARRSNAAGVDAAAAECHRIRGVGHLGTRSNARTQPALENMRGRFEILGAMALFALMPAFTRAAEADFLSIALYRAAMVAAVFTLDALRRGALPKLSDRAFWRIAAPYGLCLGVASSCFVGGYALTTVASTVFLHHLAPLVVFPLAHRYLGERAGPEHVAGAILAVLGVGALSGAALWAHHDFASARFLLGDFLALVSAIAYAGVLLMTRVSRQAETDIGATLAGAWWVAWLTIALVALPAGALSLPGHAFPATTGLALFATVFPFVLLNRGMRQVSASEASVLSFSEVLFAALVGLVLYAEQISGAGWIGGLLVLAGVYMPLAPPAAPDDAGERPRPDGRLADLVVPGIVLLLALNGFVCAHLFAGSELALAAVWAVLAALLGVAVEAALAAGARASWMRGARVAVALLLALGLARSFPWRLAGLDGVDLVVAVAILALAAAARWTVPDRVPRGALLAALAVGLSGLFAVAGAPAAAGIFLVIAALGLAALAVGQGCAGLGAGDPLGPTLGKLAAGRVLAGVALLAWIAGAVVVVDPGRRGIVDRFGRALRDRLLEPGLHLVWPAPIDRVAQVHTDRVRRLALPGPRRVLTGDQSFLDVAASILYRVADPVTYVFDVQSAETCLARIGQKALMTVAARSVAEDLLGAGRALAEAELSSAVRAEAAALGLEVVEVVLTAAEPPKEIWAAFHDVIDADEERATAVNRAQADEARLLPDARGRARASIEGGAAERHSVVARARGEAGRFEQLEQVDRAHSESFRTRVYLERIEAALDSVALVLTSEPGALWLAPRAPPSTTARAARIEQGREQ